MTSNPLHKIEQTLQIDKPNQAEDLHTIEHATKKRLYYLQMALNQQQEEQLAVHLEKEALTIVACESHLNSQNLSTIQQKIGNQQFQNFLQNLTNTNRSLNQQARSILQKHCPGAQSTSINAINHTESQQLWRTEILGILVQQLRFMHKSSTQRENFVQHFDSDLQTGFSDTELQKHNQQISKRIITMAQNYPAPPSNQLYQQHKKDGPFVGDVSTFHALFESQGHNTVTGNLSPRNTRDAIEYNMVHKGLQGSINQISQMLQLPDPLLGNNRNMHIFNGNTFDQYPSNTRMQFTLKNVYQQDSHTIRAQMSNGAQNRLVIFSHKDKKTNTELSKSNNREQPNTTSQSYTPEVFNSHEILSNNNPQPSKATQQPSSIPETSNNNTTTINTNNIIFSPEVFAEQLEPINGPKPTNKTSTQQNNHNESITNNDVANESYQTQIIHQKYSPTQREQMRINGAQKLQKIYQNIQNAGKTQKLPITVSVILAKSYILHGEGKITMENIITLQKNLGVHVDGKIGTQTRIAIENIAGLETSENDTENKEAEEKSKVRSKILRLDARLGNNIAQQQKAEENAIAYIKDKISHNPAKYGFRINTQSQEEKAYQIIHGMRAIRAAILGLPQDPNHKTAKIYGNQHAGIYRHTYNLQKLYISDLNNTVNELTSANKRPWGKKKYMGGFYEEILEKFTGSKSAKNFAQQFNKLSKQHGKKYYIYNEVVYKVHKEKTGGPFIKFKQGGRKYIRTKEKEK